MPSLFRATVLAATLATLLPASAAVDLNARVPVGPRVKVGKLANGPTYYIQRNGKPEHRVELRLVVKPGSVLEDEDRRGLAHVVEHLAFNGSAHLKKQELVSYLQSIGVKFGADLNAYTGFDETVYMLPVPTDRKENVETAFTALGAGGVAPALAALEPEQQRVRQFGFTEAEPERGLKEKDTTDSSRYVAEYQRNFLAGEPIPAIDAEFRLAQETVPAVTLAEVNAAARLLTISDEVEKLTVAVLQPEAKLKTASLAK